MHHPVHHRAWCFRHPHFFYKVRSVIKKLTILYQDPHFIAVHKPSGLFVHKSILGAERDHAMGRLRNQMGHWVYPVHRLDRATSGVLLFAANSEAAGEMSALFRERKVEKTYWAVVRGYMASSGVVEKPVKEDGNQKPQEALTRYQKLGEIELNIPAGKHPTTRYSLVELKPETGRRHQLRKHCKSLFHPIVGDTVYGDGLHNRLWRDQFHIQRLLLMARSLAFTHPYTGQPIVIHGSLEENLVELFLEFNWPVQ